MAVLIGSAMTLTTAAYTKTADLIAGTYQFVGKGKITLVARGSAVGMNASLLVGGIAIIQDQALPYFGATGGLSVNDHVVASQVMNGGRIEFYLRNTTVGALTTDYAIYFEPM
jgi:hypothetical protein